MTKYNLQEFKNWISKNQENYNKNREWDKVFDEFDKRKTSGELFKWNSRYVDGIEKNYASKEQENFLKSQEGELTLFGSFLLDDLNFGKMSGLREKREEFFWNFFAWIGFIEEQESQLSRQEKETEAKVEVDMNKH